MTGCLSGGADAPHAATMIWTIVLSSLSSDRGCVVSWNDLYSQGLRRPAPGERRSSRPEAIGGVVGEDDDVPSTALDRVVRRAHLSVRR